VLYGQPRGILTPPNPLGLFPLPLDELGLGLVDPPTARLDLGLPDTSLSTSSSSSSELTSIVTLLDFDIIVALFVIVNELGGSLKWVVTVGSFSCCFSL
jgi:hypothetical protein